MSSQHFQTAHDSIHNTGTRLLQYLQEIRQSRLNEGDDNKGLQSIENDIEKALHALKEQKYHVAVIAAMKAGKSTFLNAVIGADILASESAACTICRTDVKHISSEQVPRLLEYREGERKGVVIGEGDAEKIQQKFLLRTREIREKGNPDNTIRFEIEYPIEAISELSSLAGFTLVDTPGPNEWESALFNTVALKQTALEALRTCNAILFILNYTSYKDNAVADLFKDVLENRQEILTENTGKIYFILNKVDQKTEKDRDIADVIQDLKRELISFGFPNPIIYPTSSRQGLLAKLIKQNQATDSQINDFEDFFSAKYAERDTRGRKVIPLPSEIAPKALKDSGLPLVQETVIKTITQNSGWNLLSDVLAKLDKSAKAIADTLNTSISAWNMEIESLKQKVEEYKQRSQIAKLKVGNVKKSVEEQKEILLKGFNRGIDEFTKGTKSEIHYQIEQIANSNSKSFKEEYPKVVIVNDPLTKQSDNSHDVGNTLANLGGDILDLFSKNVGNIFRVGFRLGTNLVQAITESIPDIFHGSTSDIDETNINDNLYVLRLRTKEDAEKFQKTINDVCSPNIQRFWIETQDNLVRNGNHIRLQLTERIKSEIQDISNELSKYLGDALEVDLNVNDIQFPGFEFSGIDAKIKQQQALIKRTTKEPRKNCCDQVYYVDNKYEYTQDFYEVDLLQIEHSIQLRIDEQVSRNREILDRVIEKQVEEDFRSAEQQINNYIQRFQDEFDRLLKERETKELIGDQIRENLNLQKYKLNEYLNELKNIRASLNTWKPV